MALDLTLKIVADASEAKRELASVEKGIQQVEGASNKTAPAVSRVTEALKQQVGGADRTTEANRKLGDSNQHIAMTAEQAAKSATLSGKAWVDYQMSISRAHMETRIAAARQQELATGTQAVTAAAGMSSAAITAVSAAVGAAVLISTVYVGVLASAAKHHYEHSYAMRDSRAAVASLSQGWEDFQTVVGRAIVGNEFSIVKPINALNVGLAVAAAWFDTNIRQAKELAGAIASLIPGASALSDVFSAPPALRKGQGGPWQYIDPGDDPYAIARAKMQGQLDKDRAVETRMLNELREQDFQAARRRREIRERLQFESGFFKANMVGSGLAPGIVTSLGSDTLANAEQMAWAQAMVERSSGWMGYDAGKGWAPELLLPGAPGTIGSLSPETLGGIDPTYNPNGPGTLSRLFGGRYGLGMQLSHSLLGAMMGGGDIGGTMAVGTANGLLSFYQNDLAKVGGDFGKLSGGSQALGIAGAGLSTVLGSYAMGQQYGKGKGALAGAGQGALAGTMIMPGIGTAIGAGVGALAGWIGGMGAGQEEKDARGMVAGFEQQLMGALSAQQRLEAGGESWKATTIAVRDAYLATGHSAQEAEQAVAKLWGSSREGSDAARAAVMDIQTVMEQAGDSALSMEERVRKAGYATQAELQTSADKALDMWQYMAESGKYTAETVEAAWQRAEQALRAAGDPNAAAIDKAKSALADLNQQYDALYQTIASEAPEEEMGVIERQARAQLDVIDQQRKDTQQQLEEATAAMKDNFGEVTSAVKDLTGALKDLTANPWHVDVTGFRPTEQMPGEEFDTVPGFANGTYGEFRDFGRGTLVRLHGRERVMTEAEGRRGSTRAIQTIVMLDRRVLAEAMAEVYVS
jgi:hypothetical protein